MNVAIEETRDLERVRCIMTEPRVWRRIASDATPPRDAFAIPAECPARFLLARDGDEDLGLFVVFEQMRFVCDVHFCVLPAAWGPRARAAANAFLAWLWGETEYQQAFGSIAAFNRLALAMAGEFGFVECDRTRGFYLRNGILYDGIIVRARRPGTL